MTIIDIGLVKFWKTLYKEFWLFYKTYQKER